MRARKCGAIFRASSHSSDKRRCRYPCADLASPGDPRLSRAASAALDETTVNRGVIYLPTICLVEATYLVEKVRVVEAALLALDGVLSDDASPIQPVPLTVEIAKSLRLINGPPYPIFPTR